MSTTKNKPLDAVVQSRRWRRATSALLNRMTSREQLVFLNRHLKPRVGKGA